MTSSEVPGSRGALTAIALKVMSVTIFVAMSSLIKAAGPLPAGQIVFFRSFFAVFPILFFLFYKHELRTAFATKRPIGHILRGVVGVCSMGFTFFALTRLPLPDAITLNDPVLPLERGRGRIAGRRHHLMAGIDVAELRVGDGR